MARKKKDDHSTPPFNCPVVAVGASAGGLEAFKRFLAVLPARFGFALVFLQHLSPKHKSLLPDLCRSQRNDLDIVEIDNGMTVQPCRVHIVPPGQLVGIEDGAFRLSPIPADEKAHQLIDLFLLNLAGAKGELGIAVILSGAGTDGARGLQAIKAAGGLIYAQDPATAGHTSMPLSAIDTGYVDHIMAPEKIAQEIVTLEFSCAEEVCDTEPSQAEWVREFYRLIGEKTGYRFDHYKHSVAARRIRRRMILRGARTPREYMEVVRSGKNEAMLLASDLMIGVTSFFRDEESWAALQKEVIPRLIAGEGEGPVRVWTPACSTGEETYTVPMLLLDELERAGNRRELQIFATDLNDRTLEKAREGRYPASVTADIPAGLARKYFHLSEDGLALIAAKEMRERIVFAAQNLVADPPFSRLDLIICRNLLIYLEPKAQAKCIDLFHYALNDGGYLFLGNAETAGPSTLFEGVDGRKSRIYRKIGQKVVPLPAFAGTRPDPFHSRRHPSGCTRGRRASGNRWLLRPRRPCWRSLPRRLWPSTAITKSSTITAPPTVISGNREECRPATCWSWCRRIFAAGFGARSTAAFTRLA